MGADSIVDFFPGAQLPIELFHFQRAGRDLVELLGVGAVGAFDGAVEFRRARRQHEQMQPTLLASLFELGGELASAVDLQGANGELHAVLQGVGGSGSTMIRELMPRSAGTCWLTTRTAMPVDHRTRKHSDACSEADCPKKHQENSR